MLRAPCGFLKSGMGGIQHPSSEKPRPGFVSALELQGVTSEVW